MCKTKKLLRGFYLFQHHLIFNCQIALTKNKSEVLCSHKNKDQLFLKDQIRTKEYESGSINPWSYNSQVFTARKKTQPNTIFELNVMDNQMLYCYLDSNRALFWLPKEKLTRPSQNNSPLYKQTFILKLFDKPLIATTHHYEYKRKKFPQLSITAILQGQGSFPSSTICWCTLSIEPSNIWNPFPCFLKKKFSLSTILLLRSSLKLKLSII